MLSVCHMVATLNEIKKSEMEVLIGVSLLNTGD